MRNPYEVLGVKETATEEEIKSKYRELVKKYHPDRYQNNPLADLAEEKLREVNEAYDEITKNIKSGNATTHQYTGSSHGGQFADIRREIDRNNLDYAERLLNDKKDRTAEWYFLSGVISYKRGWYDDAINKIRMATDMDPNNMEYRSTLNQLVGMGARFRNTAAGRGYESADDACCKALQCYCLADLCCNCI